jgi:sulfite reductase alpha subunit-like flavoprotein
LKGEEKCFIKVRKGGLVWGEKEDLILVAAGTGIAAFISYLRFIK